MERNRACSAKEYWETIDNNMVMLLSGVIEAKNETQSKLDEATKEILDKDKESDESDPLANHRAWVEVMEGLIDDIRESRHSLMEARKIAEAITPKRPKSVKAGILGLIVVIGFLSYALAQRLMV